MGQREPEPPSARIGRKEGSDAQSEVVAALVAAAAVMAVPAAGETGSVVEYAIPTASAGPVSIVTGPDGALWFTEIAANKIGRITPAGEFMEFPIPTPNSQPDEINVGPDGNLWFAEILGNKIGRITPSGVITEFVVPTRTAGRLSSLPEPTGTSGSPNAEPRRSPRRRARARRSDE